MASLPFACRQHFTLCRHLQHLSETPRALHWRGSKVAAQVVNARRSHNKIHGLSRQQNIFWGADANTIQVQRSLCKSHAHLLRPCSTQFSSRLHNLECAA